MQNILLQFDTDDHASSFDQVVAIDAGVDHILSYGGINEDNVEGLVHGAIFTRGPSHLQHTAVFVGGSHVAAGEKLLRRVQNTFFGPMQVSVMMDSNGCNTTAAAAVAAVRQHLDLSGTSALVLGGTGPVGLRAALLLAREGCQVRLASRAEDRAAEACEHIRQRHESAQVTPVAAATQAQCLDLAGQSSIVIAAGAAGVCFLPTGSLSQLADVKIAVDLNAVPPTGLADIQAHDAGQERDGVVCYGALGVGGTKMKVHKQAVQRLFESRDQVLDTEEIYQLALQVSTSG